MKAFWSKSTMDGDSTARSRRLYWISGAVGVVILAAVMLGFAAFGPTRRPTKLAIKPVVVADDKQRSAALTTQGEAALASGDTTSAIKLATSAISLDSQNSKAKVLLETAKNKQKESTKPPATTPTSTPPPPPPPPASDDAFNKDISDLALLLPKTFTGYGLGKADAFGTDATVSGASTASGSTARIVWAVHQNPSAAEAQKFVTRVSKSAYGQNSASITVDGAQAYFGTDGTRFATVSFVRGKYVFEVLASSGADPLSLKDITIKAAEAFPDAPPS